MDEKNTAKVSEEDLAAAFAPEKEDGAREKAESGKGSEPDKDEKARKDVKPGEGIKHGEDAKPGKRHKAKKEPSDKLGKRYLVMLICGIVGIVGGIACILYVVLRAPEEVMGLEFPTIPSVQEGEVTYSKLTGEALADGATVDAPAYCIQTPNGTDGARPQSGLSEAGVIFEAVAEAGITRFAAIYQAPTAAVIGPIRSLRIYYLQWDTPFDCTVVHAGGADDAISALRSGGYKELDESYTYMYRGTYGARRWNNLFTTAGLLRQYTTDSGHGGSDIKGFARMTPAESEKARVDGLAKGKFDITTPEAGQTEEPANVVGKITLRFGGMPNYNVVYDYDAELNKYLRSYESGVAHEVYSCSAEDLGEKNPEDVCTLTQMAPSVVIAMKVAESRASDNYHENITTTGTGEAYIFQNGTVIQGQWRKDTVADQIKFTDAEGAEVKLAPGQTFVSAVPNYGSVEY